MSILSPVERGNNPAPVPTSVPRHAILGLNNPAPLTFEDNSSTFLTVILVPVALP